MTRPEHLPARPPLWRALLVLGMLAGVLAMHGLAPGGGLHGHEGSSSSHMTTVAVSVDETCHAGCGSGHLHHADATCVSGAVSGGPVLPGLAPDPAATAVSDDSLRPAAVMSQDGARAPPSLAELQLLRI
ncbi:DUF6153 family protein [Streptomyces canus]|uniref:DUF6153 family protein n=1 Tax=Streptomyces canus TaxID=58343 RepID=UPI002784A15A|nr:DUF6153 family protein [Streptomyces canus]MDQ1066712.1 hypothetical protein [Streptomyces canus]